MFLKILRALAKFLVSVKVVFHRLFSEFICLYRQQQIHVLQTPLSIVIKKKSKNINFAFIIAFNAIQRIYRSINIWKKQFLMSEICDHKLNDTHHCKSILCDIQPKMIYRAYIYKKVWTSTCSFLFKDYHPWFCNRSHTHTQKL